jgi:hypothetical protein
MSTNDRRAELRLELIKQIVHMGYPEAFAAEIAKQLGTEKTMDRMIRYLHLAKPRSAEEIADEMMAICEDRARWQKKKAAEYYNVRYNELLECGLGTEEEPE